MIHAQITAMMDGAGISESLLDSMMVQDQLRWS